MKARLLAAAAAIVVGLLVFLWRKLASDDVPAAAEPRPAPVATAPVDPTTPPAPAARPRIGSGGIPMMRRPTSNTPTTAPGGPEAPALPPDDAPPRKEPPPFWNTLRDQVFDTETWIAECNERALKAGTKLSGTAAYSFTLRRQGGKIVVAATGTEYSSLDPTASRCMQDVSKRMTFEELPEGVDAMVAYRKVVLEDGVLKENWMTEFHPLEPRSPETPPLK